MRIRRIPSRNLWIAVLAAGGFIAPAQAQPVHSDLAVPAATPPLVQPQTSPDLQRLPPLEDPSLAQPSLDLPDGAPLETLPPSEPQAEPLPADWPLDEEGEVVELAPAPLGSWQDDPFGRYGYRGSGEHDPWYYVPGNGNGMGIIALSFFGCDSPKEGQNSFHLGATWYLVSGPEQTDMPPRLYDLTARLGRRDRLGFLWSYDVALRPGWFSDFEGSAREGLRFPGHGVLYFTPSDRIQWLGGIDYLDRDDIACLPVFGAVWKPHPNLRFDAVFPHPRIAFRLGGQRWFHVGGEMGGGTWAIERADGTDDVATYRDYRLVVGFQREGNTTAYWEFGYVFDRHLEYRSGTPSFQPWNTALLRCVTSY